MDGHRIKPSTKVTTLGKVYEPFGPNIMLIHPTRAWCPPTDIFECADSYVIKCAISGLHRDEQGRIPDTTVCVHGNTINIRGQNQDACKVPRCSAIQMEIHYGSFQCCVQIHDDFDGAGVRADYEDGFLRVVVPKKTPQSG